MKSLTPLFSHLWGGFKLCLAPPAPPFAFTPALIRASSPLPVCSCILDRSIYLLRGEGRGEEGARTLLWPPSSISDSIWQVCYERGRWKIQTGAWKQYADLGAWDRKWNRPYYRGRGSQTRTDKEKCQQKETFSLRYLNERRNCIRFICWLCSSV